MKVNSVTKYNNQSQNRTNVKFGDCKKIVCDKYMMEAKKAFENSLLKQGLDKMYVYQVEFIREWLREGHYITLDQNYSMIIKPYKGSLLYRLKNYFNHDFKLPNLPCEIKYEARCLKASDLGINPLALAGLVGLPGLSVIAGIALQHSKEEKGLIDIINQSTVYDIREKIKNALDKKAQQ